MVGEEALAGRRSHASGSGVACLLFLPIVAACQAGFPEATVRRNNVRVTEQRHGSFACKPCSSSTCESSCAEASWLGSRSAQPRGPPFP